MQVTREVSPDPCEGGGRDKGQQKCVPEQLSLGDGWGWVLLGTLRGAGTQCLRIDPAPPAEGGSGCLGSGSLLGIQPQARARVARQSCDGDKGRALTPWAVRAQSPGPRPSDLMKGLQLGPSL